MPLTLRSYAQDRWIAPSGPGAEIRGAVDGRVVATASSAGLDFAAMARHAREAGGPALRRLGFHARAEMLKRLATFLGDRKEAFYELSFDTGATRRDSLIDIDGGIGTLFAYASRGRRELPAGRFVVEGEVERLSRNGSFAGLHILSPLQGVAVHVNAFNFPCWGMLEKLAPAILAGMPVIAKPATATAYVAHAVAEAIVASGLLPPGAFQFVAGGTGDLLDHLTGQDLLSFTGSAATSVKLRDNPAVSRNAVRFVAERDSLNAAILGPDATPETPEFDLFGRSSRAAPRILIPRAE